jgi:hypothetical protein
MIPQERGTLEGINVYFLFQLPFGLREVDKLHGILREGKDVNVLNLKRIDLEK